MVYGYPEGGTSLSITKGIVSRIEFVPYNAPVSGLRIQIDAAINPGNSGGPAVVGDHMIGLAFSHLGRRGEHRLHHPGRGDRPFPQGHRRRPLRRQAGHVRPLPDAGKPGVARVPEAAQRRGGHRHPPARRATRPTTRSRNGTWSPRSATPHRRPGHGAPARRLRVDFTYMVQKLAHDGKLPLTLVRAGKEMTSNCPCPRTGRCWCPRADGGYPSYFVYGPVSFTDGERTFLGGLVGSRNGSYLGMLGIRQPAGHAHGRQGKRSPANGWWWCPRRFSRTSWRRATQPVRGGGQVGQRRRDQEPRASGRGAARLPGRVRRVRVRRPGRGDAGVPARGDGRARPTTSSRTTACAARVRPT